MRAVIAAALLLGAAACHAPDETRKTALADGITMHIDQKRTERKGREVFLRVDNQTRQQVTISRFVLTSPRFATVRWSGHEEVGATYQTDLEFEFPKGRCGSDIDASVRLTYRLGDGELRESTTKADDPYGNAADFADRDCAETTLEEAADVEVGTPVVKGRGRTAVLDVPVTMKPTGQRSDVRFAGFGNTVLFRQAPGSPADVDILLGPDEPTAKLHMRVVPARCDSHALAEDKVGRLFPVKVLGDDVSDNASYFLPLTKPQRIAFFDYFRATCGLP